MDDRPRTYTMDELERLSGFDRRTIAYYVQEGLLPKIGRRGPRTRYPQLFLDRLLFVRQIRELEDEGHTESRTLSDIRLILERLTDEEIADVASGREAVRVIDIGPPVAADDHVPAVSNIEKDAPYSEGLMPSIASPATRARKLASFRFSGPPASAAADVMPDAVEERLMMMEAGPPAHTQERESPVDHLGHLLYRLSRLTGSRGRRWGRGSEHWTRANITRDITISARNADEDAADLLEEVARILRRLLRQAR